MFEWDENKNAANLEKHGIRFEDACCVFDDDFAIEQADGFFPDRFIRIGFTIKQGVLVVVYSEKENFRIRIISVRKANKQEEKNYAQTLRFFQS